MHTIRQSGENANTIVDVANSNCTTMLGVIHEITCHLFIYAAPGATRWNWKEKSKSSITLLVQKSVGTAFPPHYTPGYGLVWAVMINSPELPINDEARNEAHVASTDVRLY